MAPKLDLECWMQGLGLPLGDVMRATGPIMERRLSESGVSWSELDERQVIALFVSAFREAASTAFPQRDEEVLKPWIRCSQIPRWKCWPRLTETTP